MNIETWITIIVASVVLFFGDNLYKQAVGHSIFDSIRLKLRRERPPLLSRPIHRNWELAAEKALGHFQTKMPKYKWGTYHNANREDYDVSKGRAVMTITISIANAREQALIDNPPILERYELTFDHIGDILQIKKLNKQNALPPQTFDIQGGIRPAGTTWLTFNVAFPSTPVVVVTPKSDKFRNAILSNVSTTGLNVKIQDEQGVFVNDTPFIWEAHLRG